MELVAICLVPFVTIGLMELRERFRKPKTLIHPSVPPLVVHSPVAPHRDHIVCRGCGGHVARYDADGFCLNCQLDS